MRKARWRGIADERQARVSEVIVEAGLRTNWQLAIHQSPDLSRPALQTCPSQPGIRHYGFRKTDTEAMPCCGAGRFRRQCSGRIIVGFYRRADNAWLATDPEIRSGHGGIASHALYLPVEEFRRAAAHETRRIFPRGKPAVGAEPKKPRFRRQEEWDGVSAGVDGGSMLAVLEALEIDSASQTGRTRPALLGAGTAGVSELRDAP